jgi:hypothetical protein
MAMTFPQGSSLSWPQVEDRAPCATRENARLGQHCQGGEAQQRDGDEHCREARKPDRSPTTRSSDSGNVTAVASASAVLPMSNQASASHVSGNTTNLTSTRIVPW